MDGTEARVTRIPQSRIVCKIIALTLGSPLRRLAMNPYKVLTRMGVYEGQSVLEIGCGPGFFTIPAAKMAGDGIVYALDLHPLMIETVQKRAGKNKLNNVRPVRSSASETGLDNESIDLIFCIDVLSDIIDIESTLREVHRILKPDGIVSVFEPHTRFEPGTWKPERSIKELTAAGLFSLRERDGRFLKFEKVSAGEEIQ